MYLLITALVVGLAIALPVVLTRLIRRRMGPQSPWPPYLAAGLTALVFTWQEIAGYVQYQFVCRDAGVQVLGSVSLPREFFEPDGTPRFVTPEGMYLPNTVVGSPDHQVHIRNYLEYELKQSIRGFVREYRRCLIARQGRRTLVCTEKYTNAGGWLKSLLNISFIDTDTCGPALDLKSIGKMIFRPE